MLYVCCMYVVCTLYVRCMWGTLRFHQFCRGWGPPPRRRATLGSRSRQNQSLEARFHDFPALAPEVDKTSPSRLDFINFQPLTPEVDKTIPI